MLQGRDLGKNIVILWIQPCKCAGRHLYLWGKTNLGKLTFSRLWCRAQKCCQLGESPWCHIPSSRKPSYSHLQWNNVRFGNHILQILLAISAEMNSVFILIYWNVCRIGPSTSWQLSESDVDQWMMSWLCLDTVNSNYLAPPNKLNPQFRALTSHTGVN